MVKYLQITDPNVEITGNVANSESDYLSYEVPKQTARRLKANPGIQLYLPVQDTFDGDGSTTTFNLTKDATDVPRKDNDVVVYVGGSREDPSNYTVDYDADTVTFDSAPASGTDNVEVFYIPATGETVKLKVYDRADSRNRNDRVFNTLDKSLFTTDALDRSQAPQIQRQVLLVEEMELALRINADYQYSTDDRVLDELIVLEIPYEEVPFSSVEDRTDEIRKSLGQV